MIDLLIYILAYIISIVFILGGIMFIYRGVTRSLYIARGIMGGLLLIMFGIFVFFITITVQLGYATLTIK